VHPVVWGDGVRASGAASLPRHLRFVAASTLVSGVMRLSYEPLPR
jgi:hypothetical protein